VTLAATIARTYFAVRSLDSQLAASLEILAVADESVALTKKRADAGIASILDVYQAGSARTGASAQAKEVARQRAVALHQLGQLTGRLDLSLSQKGRGDPSGSCRLARRPAFEPARAADPMSARPRRASRPPPNASAWRAPRSCRRFASPARSGSRASSSGRW
jgi:outer membrane protein TolC